MSLIEFIKPNPAKAITALLFGMIVVYLGINMGLGCNNYDCNNNQQPLEKIISYFFLWPILLMLSISISIFNERTSLFFFFACMFEFLYIYLLISLISVIAKRKS